MIIIFVEFIDQLINYSINCSSLSTNSEASDQPANLIRDFGIYM